MSAVALLIVEFQLKQKKKKNWYRLIIVKRLPPPSSIRSMLWFVAEKGTPSPSLKNVLVCAKKKFISIILPRYVRQKVSTGSRFPHARSPVAFLSFHPVRLLVRVCVCFEQREFTAG